VPLPLGPPCNWVRPREDGLPSMWNQENHFDLDRAASENQGEGAGELFVKCAVSPSELTI
jgi:hypothetical protein